MNYSPRVRMPAPRPPRRLTEPSAGTEPQYRWTFTTWVERKWRDYKGSHTEEKDRRTVSVFAPDEAAAKRKVESALPPIPRDKPARWNDDYEEESFTRRWAVEGSVEEVR